MVKIYLENCNFLCLKFKHNKKIYTYMNAEITEIFANNNADNEVTLKLHYFIVGTKITAINSFEAR